MTEIVLKEQERAALVERLVVEGDLAKLSPAQRVQYYVFLCERMGLDPLARPMDYLVLDGRLTLYLNRGGAEQLRRKLGINVSLEKRDIDPNLGLVIVTVRASTPNGQHTFATGVVPIKVPVYGYQDGKRTILNWREPTPAELANAIMRAETKAIRRATLALGAFGVTLSEEELDTIEPSRFRVISPEEAEGKVEEAQARGEAAGEEKKDDQGAKAKEEKESGQEAKESEHRQRLLARLDELLEGARAVGLKRWSPVHLKNHLQAHYGVAEVSALTDDQIVELGRTIRAELEAAKTAEVLKKKDDEVLRN